jgi:hypothetical protein
MENKKILIGVGILALLGVGYFLMKKKKGLVSSLVPARSNYAVSLDAVGETGIYQILEGKKYPFSSERAYEKYGKPTIEVITQENLNLIPTGGFIGYEGQVVKE